MGPFEEHDNIKDRLQDHVLPLNIGSDKKKNKRVLVPKEEGEHGPKKIKNPTEKIEMSDYYKKEHNLPINEPAFVTKEKYIRSGDRKFDIKRTALETAGKVAPLLGAFFALTRDKK